MDICTGKEVNEARVTSLGYIVVMRLIEPFKMSGRNITCNNFFISLNLCRKLLQENLTEVGKIRKNRKEVISQLIQKVEKFIQLFRVFKIMS